MPEKSKSGTAATDTVNDAMSAMTRMQAATMGPMNWMGPASMEAFQATIQEMSDFVAKRLQKDVQTQQALLSCKSIEEIQDIQTSALREAFEDYREESERLTGIARKFMQEAVALPTKSDPI